MAKRRRTKCRFAKVVQPRSEEVEGVSSPLIFASSAPDERAWQPISGSSARSSHRYRSLYSSHDTHHNNAVALRGVSLRKKAHPRVRRCIAVILRPIPPFRLDPTVWALRRRSLNLIDRWDGTTYRRTILLGRRLIEVAVRQEVGGDAQLVITATPPLRVQLALEGRIHVPSTLDAVP